MKTTTTSELVKKIVMSTVEIGFGMKKTEVVVTAFLKAVERELLAGNHVRLEGLGILKISSMSGRTIKTPFSATGVSSIPGRKLVRLANSKRLRGRLNMKGKEEDVPTDDTDKS